MSTTLNTIRWLSIFTGALSLFYLSHTWFEFGLGEVFTRVISFYKGILYPIVDLLRPVAQLIAEHFGWTLPPSWKDWLVLHFALGGSSARGGRTGIPTPTRDSVIQRDGESFDDAWERTRLEQLDYEIQLDLVLAPFRLVVWPIFVAIYIVRYLLRPHVNYLFIGYTATMLVEFNYIMLGALIFGGINAGLE